MARVSVLRTAWIPTAEVEKTTTVDVPTVELSMEALGALADGGGGRGGAPTARGAVPKLDRDASDGRRDALAARAARRPRSCCASRVSRPTASSAASRCWRSDADALDAFRVANRAVARALRKRLDIETPRWRAFQLAFILLNLPGLADPTDPIARRWTCCSSRPAAARPRRTWVSRRSRWCCAGCATRATTGSRAPA